MRANRKTMTESMFDQFMIVAAPAPPAVRDVAAIGEAIDPVASPAVAMRERLEKSVIESFFRPAIG